MSQYINFFVRSPDNKFLPIGSFSRNHEIYQVFSNYVTFERIVAVGSETLRLCENDIEESILRLKSYIQNIDQQISDIGDWNNTIEEKISTIDDLYARKGDIEDELRKAKYAQNFVMFIRGIIEDKPDNVPFYVYAGIECAFPTIEDVFPEVTDAK